MNNERILHSMYLITIVSAFTIGCHNITYGQVDIKNLSVPHVPNITTDDQSEYNLDLMDIRLHNVSAEATTMYRRPTSMLMVEKFNPADLPMFCKMEHNIWAKSSMNVRLRLGSLDYVNKMEGK